MTTPNFNIDSVEFYLAGNEHPFHTVKSSFSPDVGEKVNIKKQNWLIVGRSFSVDYADNPFAHRMRCNLIVEKSK